MTNAASMASIPLAVVAHQGGWDEILLVAGPVAIVVALLVVARRRVRSRTPADAPSEPTDVGAH